LSIYLEDGPDDSIRLFTYLLGEDIERAYGDSDIEIWKDLKPAYFRPVLMLLLERFLTGHENADKIFEQIVKEAGAKLEEGSW
jgi:hypothetical protein